MDKEQCILFRKTTAEQLMLEVPSGATVSYYTTLKDQANGSVTEIAGANVAGPTTVTCAAAAGSLNDRCLEDLSIVNIGTVAATVTLYWGLNVNSKAAVWKGALQPNQRLRYRESFGFKLV